MDGQKLSYFLAAAATENFRKAAQFCHVAQPVLSRQIAALEQELGLALFTRHKQRVALTAAGRAFEPHARALVDRMHGSQQAMSALREGLTGAITIGSIEPLATTLLPPVVAAFQRRYPDVRTSITVRGTEELFALVEQRVLELGLCGLPVERQQPGGLLVVQELYRDPFVLGLRGDHQLAEAGGTVGIAQIARQRLALLDAHFATRRVIERVFAQQNLVPPHPVLEIDNVVALKLLVQQGVGITILPRSLFTKEDKRAGLVTLPIGDLHEALAFAIVYRRVGELSAPTMAFIHSLAEAVPEHVQR